MAHLGNTNSLKKSNSISSFDTIRLPKLALRNVDTSEFSFQKFASIYFCSGCTHRHERNPLKQSLLKHDLAIDQMAAKGIWILILQFMGDLPESGTSPNLRSLRSPEFMQELAYILGCKPRRFVRRTIKCQSKHLSFGTRVAEEFYQLWLSTGSSHLDKIHFIIGHGILREGLRDEILAQICKQLNLNPSRSSLSRGWLLLTLCLSCFPPTPDFEPYIRNFLKMGTAKLNAAPCLHNLERTKANGARSQPPSLLELQSLRDRQPIRQAIYLTDGQARKLELDAASTAREAVQQLCEGLGLTDSFGFGLVLSFHEKLFPLGAGREHIMDAISSCEQQQLDAPWKIYLRKEVFGAWYNPALDANATNLIYKQIMSGLKCGEYRCRSEKDIAMICALATFVEHGAGAVNRLTSHDLTYFVPEDLLAPGARAVNNWSCLIASAYESSAYVKKGQDSQYQLRAKEDICLFAHLSWPLRHSRLFEVLRLSGPKLITDDLMLAINATGLALIDETQQVLAACSYTEIINVYHQNNDEVHIFTAQDENFVLQSSEALDAVELIDYMILNLQQRSSYGIVTKSQSQDNPVDLQSDQMSLSPGDLVQFEAGVTGAQIMADSVQRSWRGLSDGTWGKFMAAQIRILPTLSKPSLELQQVLKSQARSTAAEPIRTLLIKKSAPHNLTQFAERQFRSLLKAEQTPIWCYSAEPLKAPLLRALHDKPQLYQQALVMHHHILKYMGDIIRGSLAVNTDHIFQPALQHHLLCDELYCQLMKQLSGNPREVSEQRGWDLLYLATGIMVPSVLIMREVLLLLRFQRNPLADAMRRRLKLTVQHGQRKHPPHLIEVEGIQQRCMHIYHKIYFPDATLEAFEIESHTRGSALIEEIARRLELKSHLGFGIFVKMGEKVFAMPESDFVFDFITELLIFLGQQKTIRTSCDNHYQLHFMRKLWLVCSPGLDRNADLIFNYPQELVKYLKGYYAIDMKLALKLARLIYTADRDLLEDLSPTEILSHIVPEDLLSLHEFHEWQEHLLPSLNNVNVNINVDQAKLLFLQELDKQPCFGSTFFAVRQLNEHSLPEHLLIGINSAGFHLLDPHTKELLCTYSYTDLGIWSSGKNYFHIRFGNMIGASKLLCNTNQGHKMDDLLTSYMKYLNDKKL